MNEYSDMCAEVTGTFKLLVDISSRLQVVYLI